MRVVKVGWLDAYPTEANAVRALARVVSSAIRAAASPGDPGQAFANAFLSDLQGSVDVRPTPSTVVPVVPVVQIVGPEAQPTSPVTQTAFDDEGNLMPGGVDKTAPLATQQQQLLVQLQAQGMSAEDAGLLTYETLSADSTTPLNAPSAESASWSPQQLQARVDEVERLLQEELAAEQARHDSLLTIDDLRQETGGARIGPRVVEPVVNGNFAAALNSVSDLAGLLQPMGELRAALGQLQTAQVEARIESLRASLRAAGMSNVPQGFEPALVAPGGNPRDYAATIEKLQNTYQEFLTNKRYTETWGANWRDLRMGRSQLTVPELEATVLKLQQKSANAAYENAKVAIASGELPIGAKGYAHTVGIYLDARVRSDLRAFGQLQNLSDSAASDLFAVNRLIRAAGLAGIPDLRIGTNLISDVTLAPKDGTYEQLQRWNLIRPNDTIIVRPDGMPGGGSYVIPRSSIRVPVPLKRGG